jgi:hypothetical protein
MVVLDDCAPTLWMQKEIAAALENGIPVQTIYCTDHFQWPECGKDTWFAKGINRNLTQNAFSLPTIRFNTDPLFLPAAREEMMRILSRVCPAISPTTYTPEVIADAFHKYDLNGDGWITREELASLMRAMNPMVWTEHHVNSLFEEADLDCNGLIDYSEFSVWLCRTPVAKEVVSASAMRGRLAAPSVLAAPPVKSPRGMSFSVPECVMRFAEECGFQATSGDVAREATHHSRRRTRKNDDVCIETIDGRKRNCDYQVRDLNTDVDEIKDGILSAFGGPRVDHCYLFTRGGKVMESGSLRENGVRKRGSAFAILA